MTYPLAPAKHRNARKPKGRAQLSREGEFVLLAVLKVLTE